MKKVVIIILFLNQVIFKSQITLNWSVNVHDNTVHLILKNNSNDKVALPINLENLQAYFSDHCLIREPDFNRNYLHFSPAIVRCSEGNKIQPVIYPSVPYIDTEEFDNTKLKFTTYFSLYYFFFLVVVFAFFSFVTSFVFAVAAVCTQCRSSCRLSKLAATTFTFTASPMRNLRPLFIPTNA